MKDYKWGKGIGFMLLCFFSGVGIAICKNQFKGKNSQVVIIELFSRLAPSLFVIALVCGLVGIAGYFYFDRLFKKDGYSNEKSSFYKRHKNKMSILMILCTICGILNLTAFGVNLKNRLC